jgi:ribulose-5-phosphate 4-epimerase/fuculose-1-phosphate aldolase
MENQTPYPRRELAAVHRICFRLGYHEAIDNHLSVRVPNTDDEMWITPYPFLWSEIKTSDLLRVRFTDATVLEGSAELEQTSAIIHCALQRAHPHHGCFMHTHMPWATAIACRQEGRLRPIHQHLIGLYHDIAYLDEYGGEVLEAQLGDELAVAMGDRSVLFAANHGIVTAGNTPARAFERMYFLERACQFQITAETGGHALREIDKRILEAPSRRSDPDSWGHADQHLAAWMRRLDREEPDYRS